MVAATHNIADHDAKLARLMAIDINRAGWSVGSDTKALIAEFGGHYMGWKPSGCSNCYNDALIRLQILFKRKNKLNIMNNYILKVGTIIAVGDKFITSSNAQADDCRMLLLTNPLWLRNFVQLPLAFERECKEYAEKNAMEYPAGGILRAFLSTNGNGSNHLILEHLKRTLAISDEAIAAAMSENGAPTAPTDSGAPKDSGAPTDSDSAPKNKSVRGTPVRNKTIIMQDNENRQTQEGSAAVFPSEPL
jgi:hypothetical protein